VGPLRGREYELAELARLVAAVSDGAGGAVIVEGAAGIGKTRLLGEAAAIATAAGMQVAAGTSDELDRVTPWAPLLQALRATSPVLVSESDLAPLRAMADQRMAVLEYVRTALERASRRRPILITLDDLQWADPATLLAAATLPNQLFSYPVGWILAVRALPATPQLESLTARLREAGAARLHLGPLKPEAAAELAADVIGGGEHTAPADLVRQAGGNPLFVIELLRAAGDPPAQPAGPGGAWSSGGLPPSLRSAVDGQLRSVPDAARNLLKVASVLGREFTVLELANLTGQPASQLMPALEQALAAEVLTEHGDALAFRHDLLRETIYEDVPVSLRQALHRDAAATLRRSGAPLARVAAQFAAGARPGDDEAIDVLSAAARELSATAPSAAADIALQVLDLLGTDDQRRGPATAAAVTFLGWAGRLGEARGLGEGYLGAHRAPAALEAEIELGMRRAWGMSTGIRYPRPIPGHLLADPDVPASVRADLITHDQVGAMWDTPPDVADAALRTAAELLARDGRTDVPEILAIRVALAHHQCQLGRALEIARSGLSGDGPASPPHHAAIHLSTIASCLAAIGRPTAGLEVVEQARTAAFAAGRSFIAARCQSTRSMLLLELGRVEDARAEARGAARLAEDLSFRYYLGQAISSLVEASIRQGDLGEARSAAGRLAPLSEHEMAAGDQHWAPALCADAAGRPDLALAALEPMLDHITKGHLLSVAWYPSRIAQLTAMALRAGRDKDAHLAAEAAADIADRNPGVPSAQASAAHARGLCAADVDALAEAVALLAPQDRPLATAAAEEDLGRALAATADKRQAIASLEAAYTKYQDAGATRDLARVRSALHALGVRKRQPAVARPDRGWPSLTRAELAVVQVVAEGKTNREAAAQLYLSADTVNTHLRHAFAKLGIRSRVELARLVLSHPAQR
jgi:DNA-binding CsgD family transcriptional regulator